MLLTSQQTQSWTLHWAVCSLLAAQGWGRKIPLLCTFLIFLFSWIQCEQTTLPVFSLWWQSSCSWGPSPAHFNFPLKKSFWAHPLQYWVTGLFSTHTISPNSQKSLSVPAGHCLSLPNPCAGRVLLSGTLLVVVYCHSYGCAASCVCMWSGSSQLCVYKSLLAWPGSSLPWEVREPRSCSFCLGSL